MSIKRNEFNKIKSSPVIIGLLLIFIFFNLFTIYNKSLKKDELKILNNIVDKFGYKINNKMLKNFKKYNDKQLKKMNDIIYSKTSNNKDCSYTKDERNFFKTVAIEENYYTIANNIDSIYFNLDPMKIAEAQIKMCRLTGEAADTVREEYKEFNKRFDQLIKNGEHKNLFFIGKLYKIHSLLFETLFKRFIFEIIILVVISTSYLANYEFDNNTQLLSYSTKRGRNFIIDKFFVSLISNFILASVIIGIGLLVYFSQFNYKGLWKVPISNFLMTEVQIYMSKWNMNFLQYLILEICVIYILILIFTSIVFFISQYVKNSYVLFFVFAMIFLIILGIPNFMPRDNNAIFIVQYNPFQLSMDSSKWFMENGAFTTFKNYELVILILWSSITVILTSLAIKTFKKTDIY